MSLKGVSSFKIVKRFNCELVHFKLLPCSNGINSRHYRAGVAAASSGTRASSGGVSLVRPLTGIGLKQPYGPMDGPMNGPMDQWTDQ